MSQPDFAAKATALTPCMSSTTTVLCCPRHDGAHVGKCPASRRKDVEAALQQVRREALEEIASAMCEGCRIHGKPIAGIHQKGFSTMACQAPYVVTNLLAKESPDGK